MAALAQQAEKVDHLLQHWWFDTCSLLVKCQSVLKQDTEPQTFQMIKPAPCVAARVFVDGKTRKNCEVLCLLWGKDATRQQC